MLGAAPVNPKEANPEASDLGAASNATANTVTIDSATAVTVPQTKISVPEVSRKRLVLPVLTILLISLLSILAFLWATSRALNDDAAVRDVQLASSLLAAQRLGLEAVVRGVIVGGDAESRLLAGVDRAWVENVLGPRLQRDFSVSTTWLLSPEGEADAAIVKGEGPVPLEKTPDIKAYFRDGLLALLARLEREPAADQRGQSQVVSGYLVHENVVHLVAAAKVLGTGRDASGSLPVLLISQAIDESFLIRGGINFVLKGLALHTGPIPQGRFGISLIGEKGGPLAYISWQADRPGDGLIWPLSPALGSALIAIGYFLLLFVRGADMFMERQANLAAALHQEQNLRNLKSRFVSMVSHELRTPLATIRNATEVLERYNDRMTESDRAEETAAIHRSVNALVKLVDNMLVIGRSEWLAGASKPRPIDLLSLCHEVWAEVSPGFEARSRLLIGEEGKKRDFYGDPTAMRALLSNLLSNALKYSRGAEEVMVTIIYKPRDTLLRITDFGMGIGPKDLGKIFEPFERGENAEHMTGSGLGLAIAKAAAGAMGGVIRVQSQLEKGTTFEITFPQDRAIKRGEASDKRGEIEA